MKKTTMLFGLCFAVGCLFVQGQTYNSYELQELQQAAMEQNQVSDILEASIQSKNAMAQIIPNAGQTETFNVADGDFFYDPTDGVTGGPGGDCSTTDSGNTGDYPNCGCITTTTLVANDLEVTFLSFRVFGNFDWLNIYDGPDTSSTMIYESNVDGDDLTSMIATLGNPPTLASTTGSLTFEFNSTTVVNTCGWEVEISTSGGGGFPAPYCGSIEFGFTVEPITNVEVADISNTSSAAIGGDDHEDFTAIIGTMEQGESYPIALEGNTDGDYTNYFTVFIDWDQNDILDDAGEVYEIGSIVNSNGTDGQQATGVIDVPATATLGQTRMRVFKNYNSSVTDPCGNTNYGQVEDYTIEVVAASVSCDPPTAVTIDDITDTEVDFSWTASADETDGYIWTIMNAGDDPDTDTPAANGVTASGVTEASASDLESETDYELYVRTDCGGGESDWTLAEAFTTDETVGVNNNPIDGFAFYPNPAVDIIQFIADVRLDNVVLYNLSGQVVAQQHIGVNNGQLNVSNLSAGVYLLKVAAEGQTGVYRLIKR